MAKAWLREDGESTGVTVALESDRFGVPAFLAGDVSEAVSTSTQVEIRQREFAGYDGMGNPVFQWQTVVSGPAIVWEVSDETNAYQTMQSGTCTVLYDGDVLVTEGATVVKDGKHWDVIQVKRPEGRLELRIRRVEAT